MHSLGTRSAGKFLKFASTNEHEHQHQHQHQHVYLQHKHGEENSAEHGASCGGAEDAGSCDVAEMEVVIVIYCRIVSKITKCLNL